MANLLLSIIDGIVTFGGKPLFEDMSLNINAGDKICIVGKNGAGKTTLMHMVTGDRELDGGKRWQSSGLTIGYLQQDVKIDLQQTVYDYIYSGLQEDKRNDDYSYMVDMVISPLELDADALMCNISGGQIRRASIGRALVEEPDILLLDEPTNHLDLQIIQWLEEYLRSYRGALLCISHDRTFLKNISQKVFWLDRGKLRVCPKGYSDFDRWSNELLEQERRELENRSKIVAQEVEWANKGVKARRKRNIRRVEEMKKSRDALKSDKSLFNKTMRKISLEVPDAVMASKIIVEFFGVSKSYFCDGLLTEIAVNDVRTPPSHNMGTAPPTPPTGGAVFNKNTNPKKTIKILDKFSLRVLRGDRIGILGRNGSGKSSFLKMLVGELQPDAGKIKVAKTVEIAYFDQYRSDLDDKKTLWKTLCPGGGDYVEIGGKSRHVVGYLKDFLFDPRIAKDRVGTLSGGQKNRLLLAKILANPGNLLILDEPTNDLDMDTLDMLTDVISKYKGTLFIVSHDRDFLDQTVNKIIAFEGDGQVDGYIGGYSDYLESKQHSQPQKNNDDSNKSSPKQNKVSKQDKKKLSYKIQYELDNLPEKIKLLEREIELLNKKLSDSNLYINDPEMFDKTSRRVGQAINELDQSETRWLELTETTNNDTII